MAKRVNKKFLVILTTAVMGTGIAAIVVSKVATRGDAKAATAAGDHQAAAGDWEKAQKSYGEALRHRSNDVGLIVKYGDALHELVRSDPNLVNKDVMAWERALQIDPNHVPALQRVMDSSIKAAEFHFLSPVAWDKVRDSAGKLAAADPNDTRAKAWSHIAVIYAWLAAKPTAASEIDQHLTALAALSAKDPADATIPFAMARAYLRRAEEALPLGSEAVKVQRDRALAAFAAVKTDAQKNNPALLYRYCMVLMATSDQNLDGQRDGERVKEAKECLYRAQMFVEKDHELYGEMKAAWVQELRQQRKAEEAEREARKLLAELPNDMRARLTLATVLRHKERKAGERDPRIEAIEVLAQPAGDDAQLKGYAGLRIRQDMEARRLVDLIQLRLDYHADERVAAAASDTAAGEARAAMRARMDDELRRLAETLGNEAPVVLKLRGYVRLLDNTRESLVEGIRLMESAHARLNPNNRWNDVELALRLAQAYLAAPDPRDRQPEQAKQLLATIANAHPRLWVARKRLAELYLRDREYDRARPHVEAMAADAELKDDADVMRYRLVMKAGLGNTDEVKQMALAMPERTAHEQWLKVNALQAATLGAEAEALARKLSDAELADPAAKEFRGTNILAQILKRNNKGQEAMDLIARARQKAPKNLELEVMELVLQGKLNEANEKIAVSRAGEDPVLQAINKANHLADQGKGEEALGVLRAEQGRTPNDVQLMEAIFHLALGEGKLDVAEEFGGKLEKLNADQSGGLSYRARLKLARRDLEGALRDAQELARTDTRVGTFVIMGQVQQAMGQADAAVVSYQKALDRQSNNFDALRGIVESYLALNQINSAEDFVRQGMRDARLATFFEEVQRRIIEHHRDPRLVTPSREKAIEQNPDVPRGYVALADNQIRVANWLVKNKNDAAGIKDADAAMNRATETLRKAAGRWPDDIVLVGRLAEMYLRLEKFDEAVAAIKTLAGRERWNDKPEPHQLLANLHLRTGKPESAIKANEEMETALAKSNNSFAVRQQMVTFYLQTGQVERGIELLRKLVAERDDRQLRTQLVEVLVQVRRFDDAEELVQGVLAKDANDARMLAMRGFIRMSQGRSKEALDALAAALKVDPNYAPALYYRGLLRLRTNDLAAAVDDLSRARDLSPTNVDMRLSLADALKRRGQLEESTKELEVALRASPSRRDVRQRLFDVYFADKRWVALEKIVDDAKNNPDLAGDPTWRKAESQMWLARDNPEKAMAAIKVASRLAPGDPEVDYQFLEILQQMKDYEEVLRVTDQVIAKYKAKPWWMYLQRGLALDALKRAGEAEVALDAAMSAADQTDDSIAANRISIALEKVIGAERTIAKLEPRVKPYWALEIASMRLQRGEWSKAVAVADQILQKDYERLSPTQRLRALTLAGQIYTSAMSTVEGALEKAEQAYVRFLSETEKQGTGLNSQLQALNNLAFLFSDHPTKPNPQRALGYSGRAYDLMQQANAYDVSIADTHGWVLILNDRTDEGMEVLKTALSKKPLPDTHYHLGEAYLRKAQYSEANAQFEQAAAVLKQTKDRGGFVDPALQDKLARAVDRLKASNKSANAGN